MMTIAIEPYTIIVIRNYLYNINNQITKISRNLVDYIVRSVSVSKRVDLNTKKYK